MTCMISIQLSLLIVLSRYIIIATSLRCNEDTNGSSQIIENCRACVIYIAPATLPTTTTIKTTILSKEMFTPYGEPPLQELVLFGESKQSRRRRRRQFNVDTTIHQQCARELDGPLYGYDQTHCYCNSNQCNSNIQRCIYEVTSKRHFACYHGTNSSLHSLEIRPKCRSCRIRIDFNSLHHYECLTFGEREQKNRTHCTCQRPMCNQDISTCQRLQSAISRPRTNLVLDNFLNSNLSSSSSSSSSSITTTTITTTTITTTTTPSTTMSTSTSTNEITTPTITEILITETIATTLTITTTTISTTTIPTTTISTTTISTTTISTTTISTSTVSTTPITTTILTTTTISTATSPTTTSTTISSTTSTTSTTTSTTLTTTTSTRTTRSTPSSTTISTTTVTTTTITTTLLISTTPITTTLALTSETEVENFIENSTIIELTTTNEITTSSNEVKHLKTDHIEIRSRAANSLPNFLLICTLFQSFVFLVIYSM